MKQMFDSNRLSFNLSYWKKLESPILTFNSISHFLERGKRKEKWKRGGKKGRILLHADLLEKGVSYP